MMPESQHPAGLSAQLGEESEAGAPRSVLVVRSGELRERVGAALAGAGVPAVVEASPSYLSAMGRLVNEKPDVIIGPISAMTGMVSSTVRALRKLCPAARLVAVAEPHERAEANAARAAGFDHCIFEPAEATAILSALGVDMGSSAPPASTHNPPVSDSPVQAEPAQENTSLSHQPIEQPAPVIDDHEPLGDIDLVESLLADDHTLAQRATRLIASQSGIGGVALARSADQVPQGNAVVAVQHQGRPLGLLHAPAPARSTDLSPWADWLSRWLALEEQVGELRKLAMTDELTGVWNRRYFQRFLERRLQEAASERQQVTLLVFDIDDFKSYNDRFGHPAGDEILRETARLIQTLVRDHDVVARIGGDEFAVVFWDKGEPRHLGSQHPDNVIAIARRFQKAICEHKFPKLGKEAVGQLTVSGGLAGFPWDGRTPEELIAQADTMALQSKRNGKNAVCFGPGAAPNGSGNGSQPTTPNAD